MAAPKRSSGSSPLARRPAPGTFRARYFVAISIAYILLGCVIIVRSAMGHVLVIGILGLIFVALGLVRLRDASNWAPRR